MSCGTLLFAHMYPDGTRIRQTASGVTPKGYRKSCTERAKETLHRVAKGQFHSYANTMESYSRWNGEIVRGQSLF